ncbi:MAG: metallophosphoesterase [Candidatus Altiarchaeota archaeon]
MVEEILPGFRIVDLALYLEESGTLVFADVHLGYEECLNRQGIMVPRFQYRTVIGHLDGILEETAPERIVIGGDLKHEFGRISEQEWTEVLRFLDRLKEYDIVLVKGNHDTILGPIAGRKNVRVEDDCIVGKTLITHGHRIPDKKTLKKCETIVIGHEHPAIGVKDETMKETVKCFLKGKYEGKNLIVMPSFNFITEGTDVLNEEILSPFLKQNLDDFEAYCVEERKVMYFGRIGKL